MNRTNFEKTQRAMPRRNETEMEAVRVRKGKLNKHARGGRTEWEAL